MEGLAIGVRQPGGQLGQALVGAEKVECCRDPRAWPGDGAVDAFGRENDGAEYRLVVTKRLDRDLLDLEIRQISKMIKCGDGVLHSLGQAVAPLGRGGCRKPTATTSQALGQVWTAVASEARHRFRMVQGVSVLRTLFHRIQPTENRALRTNSPEKCRRRCALPVHSKW